MANWIPSVTWAPVPGGLCSCSEIQEVMASYNNKKSSWFQLPIFGELDLNIQGRKNRTKGIPHVYYDFYIAFRVSGSLCAESGQSQKSRGKGTAKGDLLWKCDPAIRGRAAPSPDSGLKLLLLAALHSSAHSSANCASILSGPLPAVPPAQTLLNTSGAWPRTSLSLASHSSAQSRPQYCPILSLYFRVQVKVTQRQNFGMVAAAAWPELHRDCHVWNRYGECLVRGTQERR